MTLRYFCQGTVMGRQFDIQCCSKLSSCVLLAQGHVVIMKKGLVPNRRAPTTPITPTTPSFQPTARAAVRQNSNGLK